MATFFSDHFGIDPALLDRHGAFDISLVTDLPLFIDPFLLFNSKKKAYRDLHDSIIRYLIFLKEKAHSGEADPALLRAWYCFPEIPQTWLGFSEFGNQGSGLGIDFARSLHGSLHELFPEFGTERITRGSHLEKVCLVRDRVGRDNISDFTTNLIKAYLCQYTQDFALENLHAAQHRAVSINNSKFNYKTEVWEPARYTLPWVNGDFVILTPKDFLLETKTGSTKTTSSEILNSYPLPSAMLSFEPR